MSYHHQRRPSLQIDGILFNEDRDDNGSGEKQAAAKKRVSLTAAMGLDSNSLLNTKNRIISRSTKGLHESMEVKETLDAKTFDDESGDRCLNQYAMGKILGKGSFGTVYRAYDKDANRYVAIKEFSKTKLRKQKAAKSGMVLFGRGRGRGRGGLSRPPPEESKTPENPMELVRSEIAILKKLNHINVVKLFEVLDDPNQDSLYMVFELCEKGCVMDISMEKDSQPLSVNDTRDYFRQMILGIEYLHENNISHRDIKPDNMMISADGILKIVDFGVSEMFKSENDKLEKSAGSPAFYPPEVCVAHHGELSARAHDVWALGVTLFCMYFGTLPFKGSNILQLYESIRNDPVPFPTGSDPILQDLLLKMLDKNPETRIVMDDIRNHPWVTENGEDLLLSKDENCYDLIEEITESDLSAAIKPIGSLFTVLKAVSKLKKIGKSGMALDRSTSFASSTNISLNSGVATTVSSKMDLKHQLASGQASPGTGTGTVEGSKDFLK